MNIYIDFILFALIILVYWIITELFTILFRFTGLPDERVYTDLRAVRGRKLHYFSTILVRKRRLKVDQAGETR